MKILLIIFSLCFITGGYDKQNTASSFCEGFKQGYKDGYCYRIVNCLEPMTPMCPMPKMGETTYKHGYNRGFLRGMSDR